MNGDRRLIRQINFRIVQPNTLSHQNLALDEVHIGDNFRHGVFDLNPRIHFNEVKPVGVHIDQKLDSSGILIVGLTADRNRGIANRGSQSRVKIYGWRNFNHLLVTPLYRAVSLIKVYQIAVHVAQKLHFDVLGPTNEFFEENVGTAKRRQGFPTSLIEGWVQLFGLLHHTHTATAATQGRLHEHWKP